MVCIDAPAFSLILAALLPGGLVLALMMAIPLDVLANKRLVEPEGAEETVVLAVSMPREFERVMSCWCERGVAVCSPSSRKTGLLARVLKGSSFPSSVTRTSRRGSGSGAKRIRRLVLGTGLDMEPWRDFGCVGGVDGRCEEEEGKEERWFGVGG